MNVAEKPDLELPLAEQQAGQEIAVRQPESVPAIRGDQAPTPGALLTAFMELARDPNVRPEVLTTLAGMQERAEDRQAEREFNQAMFRVQRQLKPMIKKGLVSLGENKGSYKFLRREDLDAELRPIYEAEGFSLSFTQRAAASGGLTIYIKVRHTGGHSETNEMELPADTGPGRSPLQARVSTISFAERVLTEMAFNVVRADDNGVAGGKKFISEEDAAALRALATAVGQKEGSFLDQLFAGAVRSFDEIEAGPGYLACRSTLEAMKRRNEKRAAGQGAA